MKTLTIIVIVLIGMALADAAHAAPRPPDRLADSVASQPHEWRTKQYVAQEVTDLQVSVRHLQAKITKRPLSSEYFARAYKLKKQGKFKRAARMIRAGNRMMALGK